MIVFVLDKSKSRRRHVSWNPECSNCGALAVEDTRGVYCPYGCVDEDLDSPDETLESQ